MSVAFEYKGPVCGVGSGPFFDALVVVEVVYTVLPPQQC